MKKAFKTLTIAGMSGLMLAATVLPAFAQTYSSNYSYQQPQQQYQYQNQNQNQNYQQVNSYNLPPLQGRVVSVPAGTMLPGVTASGTISSQRMRTGDSVNVTMNAPFYYGGAVVLPAGTNIIGTVVTAEAAGRAGKNGQLLIIFNQAITPTGQKIPLTGKIATEDGSGLLKGGTAASRTKEIAKDAAIGAGSGALFGLIGSAISGGDKSKGAALGTAIGGGLGVTKTVIDKGKDVIINAGEQLNIILDSELRAGESSGSYTQPQNHNYGY